MTTEQAVKNTEIIEFVAKRHGSVANWVEGEYKAGKHPDFQISQLIGMGMDQSTAHLLVRGLVDAYLERVMN